MKLTKKQTYEILNHSREIGISPTLLVFNGNTSNILRRIKYKSEFRFTSGGIERTFVRVDNKPYYFFIFLSGIHGNTIDIKFSPGKLSFKESYTLELEKDEKRWEKVFEYYKYWLHFLKLELDAIDNIEKLVHIPDFINLDESTEYNNYFSSEEVIYLKSGIEKIKQGVTVEFDLEDYKLNLILSKLNELQNNVDKLNKFDFKSALWGILINITSSFLYTNSGRFWEIVKESFPKLIK